MKLPAIFIVLALSCAAFAQSPSPEKPAATMPSTSQPVKDLLYNNEQKLGQAEENGNTQVFQQLLAPDFRQVLFNGLNVTRDQVLKEMKYIDVKQYDISNVQYRALGSDAALLTYDLDIHASAPGMSLPPRQYESSIWQRRDGQWLLVYHQSTPSRH